MSFEVRKHAIHMNDREIRMIKKGLKSRHYEVSEYCMTRLITRGISTYEVGNSLMNGEIIEFHMKDTCRVLVRSPKNKKNMCTCVVVDLEEKCVITAYHNFHSDNHETLRLNNYNKNFNVIGKMKELNII